MEPLVYDRWALGPKIALSLFLAAIGIFVYYFCLAAGLSEVGAVLCGLAPLPLILCACAWQLKLAVLPSKQQYLIYRGLWPLAKPHVGPVSDFRDLRFYRGVRHGPGNSVYSYHGLELRFAAPHRASIDLCQGSRKEVIDCALEFANATGVRVVEDPDAAEEDGDAGSLVAEIEARRSLATG